MGEMKHEMDMLRDKLINVEIASTTINGGISDKSFTGKARTTGFRYNPAATIGSSHFGTINFPNHAALFAESGPHFGEAPSSPLSADYKSNMSTHYVR
jgi:hypothetical protein